MPGSNEITDGSEVLGSVLLPGLSANIMMSTKRDRRRALETHREPARPRQRIQAQDPAHPLGRTDLSGAESVFRRLLSFRPGKSTRTEQAINLALAERYVQGVCPPAASIEVLQRLLGPETSLSTAQASRAAARLDEGLEDWRERPLGEVPYLFLDARYEEGASGRPHQ